MKPLVQVSRLSKFYPVTGGLLHKKIGEVKAVNDLTFDLFKGESLGVVGESGCGKSTLARLILGLIKSTRGQILFDGLDITAMGKTRLRRLRRRMQMVFQDPHSSLDPRNSIFRSLAEVFKIQKEKITTAKRNDRIFQLLDMVGLKPEHCRAYPYQLSGGQKQRAVIARALAMTPEFIILDEPTAALDVSVQAQIVLLLRKLRRRFNMSYLFISHDLALVDYFCDRIIVMYLGRIVEITSGKLSGQKPGHPYTQLLLDSLFTADPFARKPAPKIEGEVPTPFNLPGGCVFQNRCPHAQEICRSLSPDLVKTRTNGQVACHFPLNSIDKKGEEIQK
ncbi:ABC transporter ATP-binding protein [Desulfospira joergensenii]|uniref:ABC transporter ATP-binding protein n=1 Tax=Desulfospira joergensenii TaxID=53329 RepID=UPI00040C60E7|nr:ABC transporter ATP-binding protein [Desulfospira joergensenii]